MTPEVPQDSRNEIKFTDELSEYHLFLKWLKLHPAGFNTVYPDRRVNNVYFDSHEYMAYADNLSGISSRTKIRYRWYGTSLTPVRGALEIKHKRNLFIWKHIFEASSAPYIPTDNWNQIRQRLSSQLPPEGKMWLEENPMPVLINRYARKYFLSRNKKVRVTVDDRLVFFDQRFKPTPNVKYSANNPAYFVVEFKFNRSDRELASQYIQTIPIRISKSSKYCNGLRFLSGN
jgi:SPX domain protein involved in polyphosphate accumulation